MVWVHAQASLPTAPFLAALSPARGASHIAGYHVRTSARPPAWYCLAYTLGAFL